MEEILHQLRLVVYSIIYIGFYTFQAVGNGISGCHQQVWLLTTYPSVRRDDPPYHQEFQVPKMKVLNLISGYFWGVFFFSLT